MLALCLATVLPAQWRGLLIGRIGDPQTSGHVMHYALAPDTGAIRPLRAFDGTVESALGRLAGMRVQVDGIPGQGDTIVVQRVSPLLGTTQAAAASILPTSAFRVLTVLCRLDGDPAPTRDRSHFDRMLGNAFPGLGTLFSSASYGRMPTTGSRVTEWVTSTRPGSAYYPTRRAFEMGAIFANTFVRDTAMAGDCLRSAQAADPTLDVRQFDVLNLQITQSLDASYAFTSAVTLPHPAGGTVRIRFALEAGWAQTSLGTHAHELGHTLGLAHTLGAMRDCTTFMQPGTRCPYDSRWTLMSAASGGFVDGVGFGSPFIAFERERLGWFVPGEVRTVNDFSTDTTLLRPLDGAATGVRQLRIPTVDGTVITVEYRRRAAAGERSFDVALPQTGVLLHETANTVASVIDVNGDNDVNDVGTVLGTGGRWRDTTRGIDVVTVSLADTGALVITNRRSPFRVRSPVATRWTLPGVRLVDTLIVQGTSTSVSVTLQGAPSWVDVLPGPVPVLRILDAPAGSHVIRYRATDGTQTTTEQYSLEVPAAREVFARDSVVTLAIGMPVPAGRRLATTQVFGSGGRAWRVYQTVSESPLPSGLRLSSSFTAIDGDQYLDFALTGTPTQLGTTAVPLTLNASANSPSLQRRRTFVVRVIEQLLAVRDTVRSSYVVGRPVADTIVAVGGRRLPGWTPAFTVLNGALPRGLALTASGVIAGIPADTGAWSARVRVALPEDTIIVGLRGRAGRAVSIATRRWRDSLEIRQVVDDTLRATSIVGPVTWRVLDGALPDGLSLATDGRLSGTVLRTGQPVARVMAVAQGGDADTTTFAPTIARRPFVASIASDSTPIFEGDSLRLPVRWSGGDVGTVSLLLDSVPAGDSLRAQLGPSGGVLRGLARGPGDRRVALRVAVAGDTARITLSWPVRSLLDSLFVPPTRVAFGDTARGAFRFVTTTQRPTTVSIRRDGLTLPRAVTLDSVGVLALAGSRLGADTLTLPLRMARADGYRRDTVLTIPLTFARMVVDPFELRRTVLGIASTLSPTTLQFLDVQGNGNGRLDLGDVRAWVIAEGLLPRTATTAQVMSALEAASPPARTATSEPPVP